VQLAFVHDDVKSAYDRAVAAGAVAAVPLTQKPWGQTLGYLRDNNGFLVEMSSPAAW
jgi:lactoylglutathione lyase